MYLELHTHECKYTSYLREIYFYKGSKSTKVPVYTELGGDFCIPVLPRDSLIPRSHQAGPRERGLILVNPKHKTDK